MPTPIILPGIGPVNPAVLVLAFIAGFIAFLLFRTVFRFLHFIFHLGCLAIVVVAVIFLLKNVIK
jgi:hypothetical protein